MTATAYFKYSKVLRRLREGPLGVYIDVYAARLLSEGHCYQSGARCIRVVGDFSRWLACKRLDIGAVDECAESSISVQKVVQKVAMQKVATPTSNPYPTLLSPICHIARSKHALNQVCARRRLVRQGEKLQQHTYATAPRPPCSTRSSVSTGPSSRPNCPATANTCPLSSAGNLMST